MFVRPSVCLERAWIVITRCMLAWIWVCVWIVNVLGTRSPKHVHLLPAVFSSSTWKRGGVWMCKLGVISQQRLKIEVKLILSANRKSYMPRRFARQWMTLSGVKWPFGHIFGVRTQGIWPPNSNSAEIFVQRTYLPSFIIICLLVRKLSCWQTNTQTSRRRWKHPTLFATLRRWVVIWRSYNSELQNMSIAGIEMWQ